MALTAADVDALFPPMSSANPTNSNINRALRIQAGLPPLTLLEARDVEETKPESEDMPPAPTDHEGQAPPPNSTVPGSEPAPTSP
jgi:hypothetical protein